MISKNSNKRLELRPYRLKHKDGSWRYFSTNAVSIKNDLQEVIGYSGTARDITKQVSLEEELLKEEKCLKRHYYLLEKVLYQQINMGKSLY